MAAGSRGLDESALRFYKLAHDRLLAVSQDLPPEHFHRSVGPSLHSVAWHLWHAARWDDFFAAHMQTDFGHEPATQVWERERLADGWRFVKGSLGRRDAGTGMDDSAADQMRFPEQTAVIEYARQAFAYAESAIAAIPQDVLLVTAKHDPDGDTNLDNVFFYLEHLNRHLGMIEAIKGIQGLSGSATR